METCVFKLDLNGLCRAIFGYSSLYYLFTSSKLKHVNEIRNLTYITNTDDI